MTIVVVLAVLGFVLLFYLAYSIAKAEEEHYEATINRILDKRENRK